MVCTYYLQDVLLTKSSAIDIETVLSAVNESWHSLLVASLLMPVNLGIETLKWKFILSNTIGISFKSAYRSVLSGVTFGIVTPNGIGDYGGRAISLPSNKRAQGLFLNGFLSLTQLLITVVLGLLGFSIVQFIFEVAIPLILLCGASMVLLVGFMRVKLKFVFLKRALNLKGISTPVVLKDRLKVLFLSAIRYLVFSIQFVLLLETLHAGLSLLNYFALIATTYLAVAIIPTGWFSNLLVRGSIAFYLFEQFAGLGEVAVLASSLLWLINLFVPAMAGLFCIGRIDWMLLLKFRVA